MLPTASFVIYLVVNIIGIEAIQTFNGIKTKEYPKSSCNKIPNIRSKNECLGHCIITVDVIVMISHDESTHTCMCCNDITGSDIPDPNWKSYVPPTSPCADGYATYYLMPYQICLKYFPVPVSYSTAKANCHDERANLIKIDSQEKYNIFEDYHVPIANNSVIQVWVQGEKVRGQWQFDDGTPIPEYCAIDMSNKTGEIHLRANGSTSFTCIDFYNRGLYHYSCENYTCIKPTSPCADGYATYYLMPYQICLKYFPVPVSYSTAKANCHDERANLIKIDSQEKYNIFEDYHVPIANNSVIQVWVQGEKVRGQWQFDDGTPIPEYCAIDMSNKTGEIHLRANGSTSFTCIDFYNRGLYHYSCENYRVLSFNN